MILVFVAVFAFTSCDNNKKSSKKEAEVTKVETVSKQISAEEGGKVESSDGKTSIEIPGGALDADTTITMTIRDSSYLPGKEDEKVISNIVELGPSGTIFKKPVVITMASAENIENKIITAAVYHENEKEWSYSEDAAVKFSGYTETGDPIMTTATGDPIMLNATGDPIMQSATGDPIMLAATGDPIMMTATGDPIMQTATGDPIMMTTGHFTSFTFIAVTKGTVEKNDDDSDDADDTDTDTTEPDDTDTSEPDGEPVDDGDTDTSETDDTDTGEIVPEPEKVYSKVLCTGMAICTGGDGDQILCPKENEDFYGQDAQYASRKGCVAHSYSEIENPEEIDISKFQAPPFIKDDVTGLTWWLTGGEGTYANMKEKCSEYSGYGEIEDWRLPTPQEVATLSDLGMLYGNKIDPLYFGELYSDTYLPQSKSYGYDLILTSVENYFYLLQYGVIANIGGSNLEETRSEIDGYLMCVSGEKYGEVSTETYSTVTENGKEMILDSSMNLFWQKEPVKKATWKEALDYCENLEYAGHNDWRLPNKNELLSLVDYSKIGGEEDVEVISSFPGMTPDVFWSSTPAPVDYLVWILNMQYGELFPSGEVENPEDEPIVGPQQPQLVKSIKRDEIADEEEGYAVLCVRSDLDEKEETPECDGTGTGPCKDLNGIVWSSRLYPEFFADFDKSYIMLCRSRGCGGVYFYALAEMCRNLNENGSKKWRLPTIDEIRKTVTTEKLKFGGSCAVTDEHFTDSYFNEEACSGDGISKTTLNDFGIMMSGTFNIEYWGGDGEQSPELWMYIPAGTYSETGVIEHDYSIPVSELVQRCVLDKTLDDYKTAPYTDPATGRKWSDTAHKKMIWSEAYEFCAALNEDDPANFWRLPTTAELLTLVRHCENAPCRMTTDGRYSLFGDISYFWTSDLNDGKVNAADFTSASIYTLQRDSYHTADVRCVSGGSSACSGNPCASVENSTGRCLTNTDPESETGYICECDANYTFNDSVCKPDQHEDVLCTGLPANAKWNSAESITQTWSGEEWLPSANGVYNETESTEECRFKCNEGSGWNGTACIIEFPYTDQESILTWSSLAPEKKAWADAGPYCENLTEGGYDDWRLPNIDELRTLIANCSGSHTGGSCVISDPGHLSFSERVENACSCAAGSNFSILGDGSDINLWSSSTSIETDGTDKAWLVGFYRGNVNHADKADNNHVRCVRSATQQADCTGIPENADWNSAESITQKWNGTSWYPSTTGVYNETASTEECRFQCSNTFFWNNSGCVTPLPLGKICTGQNKCYQNSGSGTVACPADGEDFYGQDWYYASLGKCAPHSFTVRTVSGDNVVYDNNTGLQWQQTTPEGDFNWDDADDYCKNSTYAGHSDWRLPTPMEVFSIADGSRYQPAMDRTYFPSTNNFDSRYWWTSKESKADTTKAYYVQYYVSPESSVKAKSEELKVICVRGDGMPASSFATSTINGNAVVTDSTNGLMWQKTFSGDLFFWQDALAHCANLTYAGFDDWRLPNKNELQTLFNHDKTGAPYSDFPDISTDKAYWASTTWASSPNIAWVVHFGTARVYTMMKADENYTYSAICVR